MKRTRLSPLRAILAANLRRLRTERGWSQERLAQEADLHRTNMSKAERALHALSIDNLYWLAQALNVSPLELLRPNEESRS